MNGCLSQIRKFQQQAAKGCGAGAEMLFQSLLSQSFGGGLDRAFKGEL